MKRTLLALSFLLPTASFAEGLIVITPGSSKMIAENEAVTVACMEERPSCRLDRHEDRFIISVGAATWDAHKTYDSAVREMKQLRADGVCQ